MDMVWEQLGGLTALASYLSELGRKAQVVDHSVPGRRIIALEGSTIAFVSVHPKNFFGLPLMSSGPGVSVNGLRLLGEDRLPIEYHFIARHPRTPYPWLATELRQQKRGLLRRERKSFHWTGKLLGPRLEEDSTVRAAIGDHLGLDDSLRIEAEPARSIVRIVHTRVVAVATNVFDGKIAELRRQFPHGDLIAAFERIADIACTL